MWVRLYRQGTSMEDGTILQLKNLLNCTNVPSDVHKDVDAVVWLRFVLPYSCIEIRSRASRIFILLFLSCVVLYHMLYGRSWVLDQIHSILNATDAVDDFVQIALSSHIIATAMECFGMESLGDKPNPDLVPSNLESLDKKEKKQVLFELVGKWHWTTPTLLCLVKSVSSLQQALMVYAKELLSLVLLHEEFEDAVRGAWWHACATVLEIYAACFQSRQSNQLFYWSTVTTGSVSSVSITKTCPAADMVTVHQYPRLAWPPCDLHMEHINCACKTAATSLGVQKKK